MAKYIGNFINSDYNSEIGTSEIIVDVITFEKLIEFGLTKCKDTLNGFPRIFTFMGVQIHMISSTEYSTGNESITKNDVIVWNKDHIFCMTKQDFDHFFKLIKE